MLEIKQGEGSNALCCSHADEDGARQLFISLFVDTIL
jgi:hypothetical protein